MTIDINEQERELLAETLKTAHTSLLDEIQHTDAFEFKELLKQKLERLKELRSKIESSISESQAI
jgi:hypothetical protein